MIHDDLPAVPFVTLRWYLPWCFGASIRLYGSKEPLVSQTADRPMGGCRQSF